MVAASTLRQRHRKVFLAVSTGLATAVMIAARDVMLPFILALLIAYVLTPLVAAAQRRRVPSGVAVVLVYAIVFGSVAGFARAVTPRIALEFRNLRRELPRLSDEARTIWVPAVTERLRAIGITPPEASAPPEVSDRHERVRRTAAE